MTSPPSAASRKKKPPGAPFVRKPDPDAATLADLRRRYDAKEITGAGIARELGLAPQTVSKRLTEWGWRPKRAFLRRAGKSKAPAKKAAAKKPSAKKTAPAKKRLSLPRQFEMPAAYDGDPASMPAATKARTLKTLYALLARYVGLLDEIMAAKRVDLDAASQVAAGVFKVNAEIARLEGRIGTANGHSAENAEPGAPAFGSNLARLKSELVARLVDAAEGAGAGDETDAGTGQL